MQTFLAYPDFAQSAAVMDRARLGKQRVECYQILRAITDPSYGWQNHPAVKMWRGHTAYLALYGMYICEEWIRRGYKDTCRDKIVPYLNSPDDTPPPWLGDERVHSSHRANLLRKMPEWYGQFGWVESPDMPYFWPT